jgi:hypothetical protein
LLGLSGRAGAGPFFSEYVEGSSNNKALEIYNPGPTSLDLAGCQVRMYFNGGLSPGLTHTFASAVLAPGEVFVLAHPSANASIQAVADAATTSTSWYNGNDAVELVCGATQDVIGQIGFNPGTEWGAGLASTADNTLRRKAGICAGEVNAVDAFDPALEWDGFAQDSFVGLGAHVSSCVGVPAVTLALSGGAGSEAAQTVVTVTATASAPVVGDQTVTLGVTGAGITAGDYLLSSAIITISAGTTSGTVTFTVQDDAQVEGNEVAALAIGSPSAGIVLGAPVSQTVTITDNETACGSPATGIHVVQGPGSSSPIANQAGVSIEGIVVGVFRGTSQNSLQGFFVQEEDLDADVDPATSEGIFVYDGGSPLTDGVAVGDRVRVTGQVQEFFGMTELAALTGMEICASGQIIPTAAALSLPVPGVPNGELVAATAVIDAYYERVEGMLVSFPGTLTVAEYFQLERYGQLVLSQGGRVPTFTAANEPGVAGYIDHQIALARRKVILDDRDNTQNSALVNGTALPYPQSGLSTGNRLRGGDTITGLAGVLMWSWAGFADTDAWRVRPVAELAGYTFAPGNPRSTAPPAVGGSLKVASFNVLNYFTTIDTTASNDVGNCGPSGTLDCRGADSAAELARQTDKLATALCAMDADIVGLMEIENNATASLAAVVNAANAVPACGPYAYVNAGTIGNDAIKVALLYKTTTVATVGSHAILNSAADPRFIDSKNRPMLAQTFRQLSTDEALTVAVNHLKSKGSDCLDVGDPDTGDGQGNCNLTRRFAAQAIVDWLASDPTGSGDPDFLVIGDLNSYAKEDPIDAVLAGPDDTPGTADDYTNLVALFGGPTAYGYVFDGQTGYLDHALASPTLVPQVTGTADWHINADEPPAFDYNDTVLDAGEASFEAKPAALPLHAADAYRTSDHDPVVIGLNLAPADTDSDGLIDALESGACPNVADADSDDDSIADGVEDANRNGLTDAGETDPCLADSDGDGLQDGTERGYTVGVPDMDGAGPLQGTDPAVFVPDANPATQTNPLDADSDDDGFGDGQEDTDGDGAVDAGESDPLDAGSVPGPSVSVPALGPAAMLCLGALLAMVAVRARRSLRRH